MGGSLLPLLCEVGERAGVRRRLQVWYKQTPLPLPSPRCAAQGEGEGRRVFWPRSLIQQQWDRGEGVLYLPSLSIPNECLRGKFVEFAPRFRFNRAVLEIKQLAVNYGQITALHSVSFTVKKGAIVTLIGANGAGKTTTLRAVSGVLKTAGGEILFEGRNIRNLPPHRVVKLGISQVPEGRMIFANLSVLENLRMGAYLQKDAAAINGSLDLVFSIFPRLKERLKQVGGTLSGGEQQMLAIGRALMSRPKFLMLDEPSLGIAPLLVKTIFGKITEINRQQGITILLVEQNANLALEVSHYGYVLETGRIILEGEPKLLRENPQVRGAYLGGL